MTPRPALTTPAAPAAATTAAAASPLTAPAAATAPRAQGPAGRLLVDWATFPPVGHVIEGLQIAGAYAAACPDVSVSLALHHRAPVELAGCCSFLDSVHTVGYEVEGDTFPAHAYAAVPRAWDWTYRCSLREEAANRAAFPNLARLSAAAEAHFTTARDAPGLVHAPEHPLRLNLPAAARYEAGRILGPLPDGAPVLAVLTSGGGDREAYPSAGSWELMLRELRTAWPDAVLVRVGKTAGTHGRRSSAMPRGEAAALMDAVGAVDGYDLPVLVQLALVERAALLLSPHSGFGFAALAVGTPWLTLSGGPHFEYFHNGVPFHSLLPDTARFPAFGGVPHRVAADGDGSGPREASMTRERVTAVIPELLDAVDSLVAGRLDYEQSLAAYFPRLLHALGGDPAALASWDDVHRRFVGN